MAGVDRLTAPAMMAALILMATGSAGLPPVPPDSAIPADVRAACRADAWRVCRADVLTLDRERVRLCLRAKRDRLSELCGSRFRKEDSE
jgi:hypothetical protein